MARKTSKVQEPTAEYWAQVNAEQAARRAEYEFWVARKAHASTPKSYAWAPAIVLGPASSLAYRDTRGD